MIMRGLTCNLALFTTIYNDLTTLYTNTLAISFPKQTSRLPHNCHVDVTSSGDIESTIVAVGDVGVFVALTEDNCVVVGSSSSDRSGKIHGTRLNIWHWQIGNYCRLTMFIVQFISMFNIMNNIHASNVHSSEAQQNNKQDSAIIIWCVKIFNFRDQIIN